MSTVLVRRINPATGNLTLIDPKKQAATLAVWDRWGDEIHNARSAAAAGERKAINDRYKPRWAR